MDNTVVCLDFNQQQLIERLESILERARRFEIKAATVTYMDNDGGVCYETAGEVDAMDAVIMTGMFFHQARRFERIYDDLTEAKDEEDEADEG